MFKLIYKDIKLFNKSTWFIILFSCFIELFYQKILGSVITYTLACMMISYALCISVISEGETGRGDKIITSLPLRRKEIVLSRYLSYGIFVCASYALILIIALVVKPFAQNLIIELPGIDILLYSLMITGVFFSIMTPLTYKYGYRFSRTFNALIFMLLILTPNFFVTYAKRYLTQADKLAFFNFINKFSYGFNVIPFLLTAVIVIISLAVSIRIFENKDIS